MSSPFKFQIKDLHHGSPAIDESDRIRDRFASVGAQGHVDLDGRDGTVQLSASDYDEIALSHPHALLSYVDEDDDGEVITVRLVSFAIRISFPC